MAARHCPVRKSIWSQAAKRDQPNQDGLPGRSRGKRWHWACGRTRPGVDQERKSARQDDCAIFSRTKSFCRSTSAIATRANSVRVISVMAALLAQAGGSAISLSATGAYEQGLGRWWSNN